MWAETHAVLAVEELLFVDRSQSELMLVEVHAGQTEDPGTVATKQCDGGAGPCSGKRNLAGSQGLTQCRGHKTSN